MAMDEMFAQTDTRWAPWKIIDGNNKKAARIAGLTYIADRLEKHVPTEPPEVDARLMEIAMQAIGGVLNHD